VSGNPVAKSKLSANHVSVQVGPFIVTNRTKIVILVGGIHIALEAVLATSPLITQLNLLVGLRSGAG